MQTQFSLYDWRFNIKQLIRRNLQTTRFFFFLSKAASPWIVFALGSSSPSTRSHHYIYGGSGLCNSLASLSCPNQSVRHKCGSGQPSLRKCGGSAFLFHLDSC